MTSKPTWGASLIFYNFCNFFQTTTLQQLWQTHLKKTTWPQPSRETMPDTVMEKAGVSMLPTTKSTAQEKDRKQSLDFSNFWSRDDHDDDDDSFMRSVYETFDDLDEVGQCPDLDWHTDPSPAMTSLSSNSASSAATSDFTDISEHDRRKTILESNPFGLGSWDATLGVKAGLEKSDTTWDRGPIDNSIFDGITFLDIDEEIATVRPHVMQDFLRTKRKADSDQNQSAEMARYLPSSATLATNPLPRNESKTMTTCVSPQPHCSSGHEMVSTSLNSAMDIVVDASQKHERSVSPSDSDRSQSISDTWSRTSSGRPMDDLGDLDHHFLNTESSRLRSWLLIRSKSEPFLQHLQRQVVYQQHDSSTPQDQSTASSSKSASKSSSSSPSTSSSIPTTLSGGTSSGSKRRRDDSGEKDEQPKNKRRVPSDKGHPTPDLRLACFHNKHDPMMYRSNAQTGKRFEICETHSFENMNRL
jgi:hypothetical protein